MKRRFTLSPAQRIKKRPDFERLHRSSTRLHSKHFVILLGPPPGDHSRLGVTVTTKVDPRAIGRNRLKRCVREVFRLHQHKLSASFDIVVIARQNAPTCSFVEIEKQLVGALHQHGYLE